MAEINRLHAEVEQQSAASKKCLHAALVAAWRAGRLLRHERKRVRETMGSVWGEWLRQNFRGCHSTATKYIRLAEEISDERSLEGVSLRQMYFRLGIAMEPKTREESGHTTVFPPHIRLANRLLGVLKQPAEIRSLTPEAQAAYRQDLRALYQRLRAHFEGETEGNNTFAMYPDRRAE